MNKFMLTISFFAILGLATSISVFPFDITEVDTSQNQELWNEFFKELEAVLENAYMTEDLNEEIIVAEDVDETEDREKEMKTDEEKYEKSSDAKEETSEKKDEKKPLNDPIDETIDEEQIIADELCLSHICPRMYVPICASIDGEKQSHPSPCEFRNKVNCKAIVNERMGKALPIVKVHYGGQCKN